MATPAWFQTDTYYANKAAQLVATKVELPEGITEWTAETVAKYFADNNIDPYTHFVEFGIAENVSPNSNFDVSVYIQAKANYLNAMEGSTEWTSKAVGDALKAEGLSAWDDYTQNGQALGINPSNSFDTSKYLDAKAAALNAVAYQDKTDWDASSVAEAFKAAGYNAVSHYATFAGKGDSEVPAGVDVSVSDEEQVTADPNYDPYTNSEASVSATLTIDPDTGGDKAATIDGTLSVQHAAEGETLTITVTNTELLGSQPDSFVATVGEDGLLTVAGSGLKLTTEDGATYKMVYTRHSEEVANYTKDAYVFTVVNADGSSSDAKFTTVPEPKQEQALTTKNGDEIVGEAGKGDLVVKDGVLSTKSSETTFQPKDHIDGTESGDDDQLNVSMAKSFTGFTSKVGYVKNVENINLESTTKGVVTFNAREVSGTNTYNLKGDISLKELSDTNLTVNLEDAKKDASISFTSNAVKGKADVLNLGLKNVGEVIEDKDDNVVTVKTNGIETLNLTGEGSSLVEVKSGNTITAVTATGNGEFLHAQIDDNTVKSFDASGFSGQGEFDLKATAKLSTVALGDGANTLRMNGGINKLTATAGDGKDTLILDNVSGTKKFVTDGVEQLSLSKAAATTIIKADEMSGLDTIAVLSGNGAVEVKNLSADSATFVMQGERANALTMKDFDGPVTLTVKGGEYNGAADFSKATVLTIEDNYNKGGISLAGSNFKSVETFTVTSVEDASDIAAPSTVDLTGAILGGGGSMDIDLTGLNTKFTASVAEYKEGGASLTVTGAGDNGNVILTANAGYSTVSFTTGDGDDRLILADVKEDTTVTLATGDSGNTGDRFLANNIKGGTTLTINGSMGGDNNDNLLINASTADKGVTIDLSELNAYATATLTGVGGAADTIRGGAGDDTIDGGAVLAGKNDTYAGGAGDDVFVVNATTGHNNKLTLKIEDFSDGDTIVKGAAAIIVSDSLSSNEYDSIAGLVAAAKDEAAGDAFYAEVSGIDGVVVVTKVNAGADQDVDAIVQLAGVDINDVADLLPVA